MKSDSVALIYFSPTSTTKQVLEYIAQGIAAETTEHIDLTLPASLKGLENGLAVSADVALLGVPVYAGRVPPVAAQRLQRIQGQGVPAVVVAVYGNRAYEDALVELKDLAAGCGFVPIAGGAFIGEHSFATNQRPIANGRPDDADAAEARSFGVKIGDTLASVSSVTEFGTLQVPGNVPYKDRPELKKVAPVVDQETCILCGTCEESCPSGAISIDEAVHPDPESCILCHACVKNCPTSAIAFQAPPLEEMAEKLSRECRTRQEPEIYLAISG
ncbi:4Fe-4S binding protein [Desulfovermiculus halophilus]|uniref:4Fe-4S binding protein n=1 Tax=Desulfovermiculus halophilus TaxID=339722 RepID=UPI000480559F|nr:4Fe-4S binding protein [Desulfovermiculus halophilus]